MTNEYDLDPNGPTATVAQAAYVAASRDASGLPGARLDVAYGDHPRQRLDLFSAGPDAPVLVFFHGGYWRAGSKDTRRFPALEWLPRGVSWVAMNYRLLPDASLADAVRDIRAGVTWLAEHGADYGINPARLHLTGNSAGGHLAAMAGAGDWAARPAIASLTLISGVFDLAPLREAGANAWLQLDDAQVQELSPIYHLPPPDIPVLIGWGGDETAAFAGQSRAYGAACYANGSKVEIFDSAGKDHFQIIGEYGTPGTPLFDRLLRRLA